MTIFAAAPSTKPNAENTPTRALWDSSFCADSSPITAPAKQPMTAPAIVPATGTGREKMNMPTIPPIMPPHAA